MGFGIDRTKLPYDAMVPDESWLAPAEEGDDSGGDEKTEEIQADTLQSEGQPL